MKRSLITLTTDFGEGSTYVAAMKGVIFGINEDVTIVDLCHRIPPQDLRYTAYFLRAALPTFPPQALHVVVVDPGVGTQRDVLYVELPDLRLLVPDNGCWTALLGDNERPCRIIRLMDQSYWRTQVSNTFHGRDIFAPVAAHLAGGLEPHCLGETIDRWVSLDLPEPKLSPHEVSGEVVFIDDFGNLLTNIPAVEYLQRLRDGHEVEVGGHPISIHVRTYGEAAVGSLVGLVSSMETLEIAVVQGSAARMLELKTGAPVVLRARVSR